MYRNRIAVSVAHALVMITVSSRLISAEVWKFDFGTSGSVVADGYTRVSIESSDLYSAAAGYGWDNLTELGARVRQQDSRQKWFHADGDLLKDIIHADVDNTFKLDVVNGTYSVVVHFADVLYDDKDSIDVLAEGVVKIDGEGVSGDNVYAWRRTFVVDVADGQLNVTFHDDGGTNATWVCAGLEVYSDGDEPPLSADFQPTLKRGNLPLRVQFYETISGVATSLQWNFGDGSVVSTEANPFHQYTQAGTYSVTLTATGPSGTDVKTYSNLIQALEPAPTISNLQNDSGKAYETVPSVVEGDLQYIDRQYALTTLKHYAAMQYIRTANNDKADASASFLRFDIDGPANVYVAYRDGHKSSTTLPTWLRSWTPTSDTLRADGDYGVLFKSFTAGTVDLGGNQQGGGSGASMYLIFVEQRNTTTGRIRWTGGGVDNSAATALNWEGSRVPAAGDTIVLDATSGKDMTWDLDVGLGAWEQLSGYTGTVTIGTRYAGGFDTLHITGDMTIDGGKLTHKDNSNAATYLLCLDIGGDLTVGAGDSIDATGRGYDANYGPGLTCPSARCYDRDGSGHGGIGAEYDNRGSPSSSTYGSLIAPCSLGTGGNYSERSSTGGGCVILSVGGTVALDGVITAEPGLGEWSGGSGGSILVTAGSVAEQSAGYVLARSNGQGATNTCGGGGRIAVKLTGSGGYGNLTLDASSYDNGTTAYLGAAGTVYRESHVQTGGGGILLVDNKGRAPAAPADSHFTTLGATAGSSNDNLDNAEVRVGGRAILALTAEETVEKLSLAAGTYIVPRGYALIVRELDTAGVALSSGTYTAADLGAFVKGAGSIQVRGDPVAPTIVADPEPVTVQEGRPASFTVAANGYPTPTYQWQKDGTDIPGAIAATLTINQVSSGDAGNFRCIASNSRGSDTSGAAALTVTAAPPVVSAVSPLDTLVASAGSAIFTVTAGGTAPLSYTWLTPAGDTVGDSSSLVIVPQSQAAWDGNRYYCIVANTQGTAVSDTVLLRVVTPVRAAFGAEPTRSQDSLTTVFTDSSTGSITNWIWSFGDGESAAYTGADKKTTLTHTYREEGEYVCSLVVVGEGPAGVDTAVSEKLVVYPPTDNPLTLTARFLAADRIEVQISGADMINTNPITGPTADRVGVWINREGDEIDTASDPRVATFECATMVQSSPYVAVVNVPPSLLPIHRRYRVWVSPLWEHGPSVYNPVNAAEVVMKPLNALGLQGTFVGCPGTPDTIALTTDSLEWARVRVDKTAGVDSVGVESVILSWGLAGGEVVGSDTLSPAQLGTTPYTWRIRNQVFYGDTQQVFVRAVQRAFNGLSSDPVETQFYVGWPRPVNPVVDMRAEAVLSSRVRLNWRWQGSTEGIDQVLLWQSESPLPADNPDITATFSPETLNVTDTTYLVTGLTRETRYYFGIQVRKNLLSSLITSAASASDSTPTFTNQDRVPNTVAIDTAWFDRATNGIRVLWRVDTLSGIELEWGIQHALTAAGVADSTDEPRGSMVDMVRETTLVRLDEVRFDTTYYVGIWLRGLDGPWSTSTDSSTYSVRSPTFTWEGISYFPRGDTVPAFNGNVILRKDSTYTYEFPIDDTLDYYTPSDSTPGLVPVAIGVSMRKGVESDRQKLFVGLRLDSSALGGRSTRKVAMFRNVDGLWRVEHGSFVEGGYVWVKTASFGDGDKPVPFVAMLDTVRPSITLPDSGTVAQADSAVTDRLQVRDNCANVTWKLSYARDDEPFAEERTAEGEVCGSCDSVDGVSWTIPGAYVTERTGVRAFLVVSDGVYVDTINVSHRARRKNSDAVTTEKMEWVPISATARLDNPAASSALRNLAGLGGEEWTYDTERFRLFRWALTESNAGNDDRWVEYGEAGDDIFAFEPGRLFWVKTRQRVPVGLGSATTLSLKESFSMSLPAGEWTDMALPYRFDIRIADILRATRTTDQRLEFYEWERTEYTEFGKTNTFYTTVPLYVPGIPGVDDSTKVMRSALLGGHAIYNASSSEVRLRIPPTPASVSSVRPAAKRSGGGGGGAKGWSVQLISRTSSGRPLNTVYCGYVAGTDRRRSTYYACAPSRSRQSVRVCDPSTGRLYGHGIRHGMKGGGCAYRIAFRNDAPDARTLHCRVREAARLPEDMVIRLIDPTTTAVSDGTEEIGVAVEGNARRERFLLVGTEAFCASFGEMIASMPADFVGCRYNRAGALVELHYSVPWVDIAEVEFSAFDMRGRVVWRRSVTPGRGGHHTLVWNTHREGRRPAAGVYVVRMSVRSTGGELKGRFKQRLSIVP